MAVSTWTPKAVVDLFPKYLTKRAEKYIPEAERFAEELGVSRLAMANLSSATVFAAGGVVTAERFRWAFPYRTRDTWTPRLEECARVGFAERVEGGWRVTAAGHEAVERYRQKLRAYLRGLALPREPVARVLPSLAAITSRIPPAAERAALVRKLPPAQRGDDHVRLDLLIQELSNFRDDCHIGAWQDAGYDGPTLDALTQVWEGKTTLDDVAKALEAKQERADVERNVEALVSGGELTRDGDQLRLTPEGKERRDAVEAETDRRYFFGWPLEALALAPLGDDLTAVMDALP